MNAHATAERYRNELTESAVPFWESHCVDSEHGGYFTMLDRDGTVYDTTKYMWMQWRIVYMFATLYDQFEQNETWLDIATQGYAFLTQHGKSEDGSYYFSLNQKGDPVTAPSNIYSNCFAAMGAAALFKISGDDAHRVEAESAMHVYMDRMDDPKGRWDKSMPGAAERLNLGHFMMLANLGTEMRHCLGTDQYALAVDEAVDKVMSLFWNSDARVMMENVNVDGTIDTDSCDGRHLIPGHGLESMWFFLNHAEQTGNRELVDSASDVILGILDFAWDKEHGGLFYFMDLLGKPHYELQADMKLWWVHNEAIIAVLYAYRLTGRSEFLDWFTRLDEWSWTRFPDPEYGEWFGYLNREGKPTHMLKGGKWKTFFHQPRFLLVSMQQLNLMAESQDDE
jgi:N-acylglucosamine 2-epimerase